MNISNIPISDKIILDWTDDQIKQSRADESNNIGEDNLSLRKFPEG